MTVVDKKSGQNKERYGVLCTTRLLLFKSNEIELDRALAVYPIVNALFSKTSVDQGSFGSETFEIHMTF